MRTRRGVPEGVEVSGFQESADANRCVDAAGGPVHVNSNSTESRKDYP